MVQKRHQEEIAGAPDTLEAAPTASEAIHEERIRKKSRKAKENDQTVTELHAASSQILPANQCRKAPNRKGNVLSETLTSTPIEEQSPPDPPPNPSPDPPPDPPTSSKASQSRRKNGPPKEPMPAWEKAFLAAKSNAEKLEILEKQIGEPQPFPNITNATNT